MRHPRLQWPTLGAAIAVVLAGCGSSGSHSHASSGGPASSTTTVTRTASAAPTTSSQPTSTAPPGTTASGTSTSVATGQGVAECTSADLTASVGHGSAAAGTAYYQLELRNSSSSPCYEQGYAGVSQLDLSGHQIGASAERVSAAEPRVVVAPGQTAYATLGIADAGNYPSSCRPAPSPKLRVYPPNEKASLTVAVNTEGCADSADKLLHIKPFTSSPVN